MSKPTASRILFGRRDLLKWTGLGLGTAALTACGIRPSAAGTSSSSSSLSFDGDWGPLQDQLAERLLLPDNDGYDGARLVFNPLFDDRRPAAVAACASPEDVQACIAFARTSSIKLAARSGGHSYAGYSMPDQGLVVDLRAMNGITVNDDGTAVIGAGARLIDVYSALGAAGRCLPAGSCPSVGVSGLTLGGGIGVLARLHGLTCDKLVAADVVLADGSRKTVSADSDHDLFWALRGGGGGNFGIVTSFTFATVEAPSMMVFSLTFPAGATADVLGAWQSWLGDLPNEAWSNCVVSAGSPPTCRVGGSFVGSAGDLQDLLDDLVSQVGTAPTKRSSSAKGYFDAMRYFGGCSSKTIDQCHLSDESNAGQIERESFVASSRMLEAPMSDPSQVTSLLTQYRGMDVLFDSLGGAVSDLAPDATAFPHRSALASVQIYKSATTATKSDATRQVGEVQAALADIVGGGAYINYIDPTQSDWAQASYGDNLARLQQVSKTYDPDAFFAFAQALPRS